MKDEKQVIYEDVAAEDVRPAEETPEVKEKKKPKFFTRLGNGLKTAGKAGWKFVKKVGPVLGETALLGGICYFAGREGGRGFANHLISEADKRDSLVEIRPTSDSLLTEHPEE